MKHTILTKLRLRNFRCFKDAETPALGRVNFICGPNDAGKSTFKDALGALFSGTATGAETGQGLAGLRSRGGEPNAKWQLDAILWTDNGHEGVPQAEATRLSRTDTEGPKSQKQDLVESLTGCRGPQARACIYANELLRLDRKAAQKLVLDLIPRELVTLPANVRAAVKSLLGEDREAVDLGELEGLYKRAYQERTEERRNADAFGALTPPAVPELFPDAAGLSLAQIIERGQAIRAKVKELAAKRDEILRALKPSGPSRVDEARRALARTERDLTVARAALAEIPSVEDVKIQTEAAVAKIGEAGKFNDERNERRRKLTEALGVQRGIAMNAKRTLELLQTPKTEKCICLMCEKPLTKTEAGQLEVKLKNRWEAAEREAQKLHGDLAIIADSLSTEALERELIDLGRMDNARIEATNAVKEQEEQLEKDKAALAAAEAEPVQEGPTIPAEAGTLATRIEEGNRRAEVLAEYHGARKAHESAAGQKAAAEARWSNLNALVDLLGPGGLRKAVGGGGLAKFHEDINTTLQVLGFQVDLRPLLELQDDPIVLHHGRQIPARMLSRSEGIRFSAAFAVAAATYSGLGIVVVDDFESLELVNRAALWKMLADSGHQVFLLGVQTDAKFPLTAARENAKGAEVRFFHLVPGPDGSQIVAPGVEAANGEAA